MRQVRIVYYEYPDIWIAKSPDLPEYIGGDASLDELKKIVHEGVPTEFDEPIEIIENFSPMQEREEERRTA